MSSRTTPTLQPAHAVLCAALPVEAGTAPEWVKLMPAGTFRPNDPRQGWTLRDPAAVIAASLASAAGGMLPIDYDHAVDLAAPQGRQAPAAGWMTQLQARADGIWAQVEWTDAGARAVAAREYRFLSPSFLHAKDGTVTRILGAGLVNRPALTDLPQLAASQQGDTMDPTLIALREALGLAETADQATALAAVTTLKAGQGQLTALCSAAGLAAGTAPEQLVTAVKAAVDGVKAVAAAAGLDGTATADQVVASVKALRAGASVADQQLATLSAQVKSLMDEKTAAKVDAAIKAGKFPPAQRDNLLALAAAAPATLDAMIEKAVPVLTPGPATGDRPNPDGSLTAEQKAVCAAMGLSEDAYKATLAAQKGA